MDLQNDTEWQTTRNSVLERNCFMFNNPLMSDIKFTCGESKASFYAHKYVLATSSPVFYAMFYGILAEKSSVIHLSDAEEGSFGEFLRFLYTDECELTSEVAIKVLYQAKKYMIPALAQKCVDILTNSIKSANVLTVLQLSQQYLETELEQKCWKLIDTEAQYAIASEAMNQINRNTLKALLKRDTLKVSEVELFKAVNKWIERQCSVAGMDLTCKNKREVLGDALYEIRFLSMSEAEFTHHVSCSEVLTVEESLIIFQKFNGLSTANFPWKLSKRGINLVRCPRVSLLCILPPDCSWGYSGCPDRLCFSVSKDVLLHGVHLFGSPDERKYHVTLRINEEEVSGTFSSNLVRRDLYSWCGFDVMLKKPVKIAKKCVVEMAAWISGPPSYYFDGDLQSAYRDKNVTVTFSKANSAANGTDEKRGQFCEIILQVD